MNYTDFAKPKLAYRYEFAVDELDAAQACVEAHGFAVVKAMLDEARVAELQAAVLAVVDPNRELGPGQSRTHTSFMEHAPAMWKLLDDEQFMRSQCVFTGSDELTLNRSAAIIRNPGSAPLVWHSDWRGFHKGAPRQANEVLNRGDWPSGIWFYLTGSNPQHGGLAVIEDSHVADWSGPEGFTLTDDCSSFYPTGGEPKGYVGFDVPGIVPLFTDPGDMIVFAHRTYHAAFPNQTDRVRLSCGLNFRPRQVQVEAPWPLSAAGQAFVQAQPAHVQPLVENYIGIDPTWRKN